MAYWIGRWDSNLEDPASTEVLLFNHLDFFRGFPALKSSSMLRKYPTGQCPTSSEIFEKSMLCFCFSQRFLKEFPVSYRVLNS